MRPLDLPRDNGWNSTPRLENIVAGLAIAAIGLAFLARNLGFHWHLFGLHHAWALFVLVGAVAPARRAIVRWVACGRIDAKVLRPALDASVVASIALMFLLDVSFATWWPVFVVIGGLYAMVPSPTRHMRRRAEGWQG